MIRIEVITKVTHLMMTLVKSARDLGREEATGKDRKDRQEMIKGVIIDNSLLLM